MPVDGGATYRMRHGDSYITLALMLGVDVEALRLENHLWQTQVVPAGVVLRIPFSIDRASKIRAALAPGERDLLRPSRSVRARHAVDSKRAVETELAKALLRNVMTTARPTAVGDERDSRRAGSATQHGATVIHYVKPGDTLTGIARRYATSTAAIQHANGLRQTAIQIGQSLRIPVRPTKKGAAGPD